MSDYELAYLFTVTTDRGSTVFMDFVTILFAFLVASFFGAHQINKAMVWVTMGICGFVQLLIVSAFSAVTKSVSGIYMEMQLRIADGSASFPWSASVSDPSSLLLVRGLWIIPLAMLVALVGSIWFFFERRRIGIQVIELEQG